MSPERRLWFNIVAQAALDLNCPSDHYDFAKTCREVDTPWFEHICDMASVPHSKILKYMQSQKLIRARRSDHTLDITEIEMDIE